MYQVKGLFSVRTELFAENEHFFKGLEYQAQSCDDGFTRIIVTDRAEYPGDPIQYVASILGQSMARAAY
jgi:hypothetical protein